MVHKLRLLGIVSILTLSVFSVAMPVEIGEELYRSAESRIDEREAHDEIGIERHRRGRYGRHRRGYRRGRHYRGGCGRYYDGRRGRHYRGGRGRYYDGRRGGYYRGGRGRYYRGRW